VVRRRDAELRREQCSAGPRELVRVDSQTEPGAAPGVENGPRFRDREHALFAEHVAKLRESSPRCSRHDLLRDDPHPLAAIAAELRRDFVGREERRHDPGKVRITSERREKA
jgi:hypothetical protein